MVAQGQTMDILMQMWANKFRNEQEEQEASTEGGCKWAQSCVEGASVGS